jgi:hypothetical protein
MKRRRKSVYKTPPAVELKAENQTEKISAAVKPIQRQPPKTGEAHIDEAATEDCPFCGRKINAAATVCRYCSKTLT